MRRAFTRNIERALLKTKVVDESGDPLLVYRGEHGLSDGLGFHSRLPSLSFGSAAVASTYAAFPNDRNEIAVQPRVYPVYLNIRNPIHNSRDPFIDYEVIEKSLGADMAKAMILRYADYVTNTDNWCSHVNGDNEFLSVQDLVERCPERLVEIYLDLWPLLDDSDFVQAARARGFDGAIHNGSGESARSLEYRVFDQHQVIYALTGERIQHPLKKIRRLAEEIEIPMNM